LNLYIFFFILIMNKLYTNNIKNNNNQNKLKNIDTCSLFILKLFTFCTNDIKFQLSPKMRFS